MPYIGQVPATGENNSYRARKAINEICDLYVKHKLDNNEPITATNKSDMVLAAYEEGLVKTAAQRNEEAANNLLI